MDFFAKSDLTALPERPGNGKRHFGNANSTQGALNPTGRQRQEAFFQKA